MQEFDQSATESRTALRLRIKSRVRRHKAAAIGLTTLLGIGLIAGLGIGSATADPSAGDWQKLRNCESGGNYAIDTGNGYYGAYQFDLGTWGSVGGSGLPSQASPATQDALAYKLWQQRGWSPWTCAAIVGLPQGGSGGPAVAAVVAPVVKAPVGVLDPMLVAASRNSILIRGWAFDPGSSSASIGVRITVNGADRGIVSTNNSRADVNSAVKISGAHGFAYRMNSGAGTFRVCATAIGGKAGNNSSLGCRTVTVRAFPVGAQDTVRISNGLVVVSGWAYDPNSPGQSIPVHVYVNGRGYQVYAGLSRPDLPIAGRHGYRLIVALPPGVTTVSSFAIGLVPSDHQLIGVGAVRLPAPMGALEAVTKAGYVAGWTIDPNSPSASIQAHVYVNGVGYSLRTNAPRTDVNRATRTVGAHGFSVTVKLKAGNNKVCAYGMGTTSGNNALLGCVTVKK